MLFIAQYRAVLSRSHDASDIIVSALTRLRVALQLLCSRALVRLSMLTDKLFAACSEEA